MLAGPFARHRRPWPRAPSTIVERPSVQTVSVGAGPLAGSMAWLNVTVIVSPVPIHPAPRGRRRGRRRASAASAACAPAAATALPAVGDHHAGGHDAELDRGGGVGGDAGPGSVARLDLVAPPAALGGVAAGVGVGGGGGGADRREGDAGAARSGRGSAEDAVGVAVATRRPRQRHVVAGGAGSERSRGVERGRGEVRAAVGDGPVHGGVGPADGPQAGHASAGGDEGGGHERGGPVHWSRRSRSARGTGLVGRTGVSGARFHSQWRVTSQPTTTAATSRAKRPMSVAAYPTTKPR